MRRSYIPCGYQLLLFFGFVDLGVAVTAAEASSSRTLLGVAAPPTRSAKSQVVSLVVGANGGSGSAEAASPLQIVSPHGGIPWSSVEAAGIDRPDRLMRRADVLSDEQGKRWDNGLVNTLQAEDSGSRGTTESEKAADDLSEEDDEATDEDNLDEMPSDGISDLNFAGILSETSDKSSAGSNLTISGQAATTTAASAAQTANAVVAAAVIAAGTPPPTGTVGVLDSGWPVFLVVKRLHECTSSDEKIEETPTLDDCGKAVATKGGKFFIYGVQNKSKQCYWEKAKSQECPEGWEQDRFDFYMVSKVPDGKVWVLIGAKMNEEKEKCVRLRKPVTCAADAAALGKRVNPDRSGDSGDVKLVITAEQICASRADGGQWSMQLMLECTEAQGTATLQEVSIAKADVSKGTYPKSVSEKNYLLDPDNENAGNHMIIKNLKPDDYNMSGAYTFKLVYKKGGRTVDMKWSQTSWLTSSTPTGFKPISLTDSAGNATWKGFTGLRKCGQDAAFCSTVGWWAAVGGYKKYETGIPAWPDGSGNAGKKFVADIAELFVVKKGSNAAPAKAAPSVSTEVGSVVVSGVNGTRKYPWTGGNAEYIQTGLHNRKPRYETSFGGDIIRWESGNDFAVASFGKKGSPKWTLLSGWSFHRYYNEEDTSTPPKANWIACSDNQSAFATGTMALVNKACDWKCYLYRYPDLQKAFGNNVTKAKSHYISRGSSERRPCTCELVSEENTTKLLGKGNTSCAKGYSWSRHPTSPCYYCTDTRIRPSSTCRIKTTTNGFCDHVLCKPSVGWHGNRSNEANKTAAKTIVEKKSKKNASNPVKQEANKTAATTIVEKKSKKKEAATTTIATPATGSNASADDAEDLDETPAVAAKKGGSSAGIIVGVVVGLMLMGGAGGGAYVYKQKQAEAAGKAQTDADEEAVEQLAAAQAAAAAAAEAEMPQDVVADDSGAF